MATIEWALRRTTTDPGAVVTDHFDWSSPPGMPRTRLTARLAGALRHEADRRTIDMASLAVGRETGVR